MDCYCYYNLLKVFIFCEWCWRVICPGKDKDLHSLAKLLSIITNYGEGNEFWQGYDQANAAAVDSTNPREVCRGTVMCCAYIAY